MIAILISINEAAVNTHTANATLDTMPIAYLTCNPVPVIAYETSVPGIPHRIFTPTYGYRRIAI